jgi:hypothetical protein
VRDSPIAAARAFWQARVALRIAKRLQGRSGYTWRAVATAGLPAKKSQKFKKRLDYFAQNKLKQARVKY